MKIAVVGAGSMGGAILKGLKRAEAGELVALNPANPRVAKLAAEVGFDYVQTAADLVAAAPNVVILTTPAPITTKVAASLTELSKDTLVISAAAGVALADLQAALPGFPLVRMIPNTPVAVNSGAIAVTPAPDLAAEAKQLADQVLGQLGELIEVREDQLELSGVIGGCGPAFVDVFMDAMGDAAVKYGLDRATANRLVASMVQGSGALAVATGETPSNLRDQVTSPGGTTIRGVEALEKAGFRYAVIDAVNKGLGEG